MGACICKKESKPNPSKREIIRSPEEPNSERHTDNNVKHDTKFSPKNSLFIESFEIIAENSLSLATSKPDKKTIISQGTLSSRISPKPKKGRSNTRPPLNPAPQHSDLSSSNNAKSILKDNSLERHSEKSDPESQIIPIKQKIGSAKSIINKRHKSKKLRYRNAENLQEEIEKAKRSVEVSISGSFNSKSMTKAKSMGNLLNSKKSKE